MNLICPQADTGNTALRGLALSIILVFSMGIAKAQLSRIYLNPEIALGITSGYDHNKGLGLDAGNPNRALRLELRGGYKIDERLSVFTGFGFCAYRYRMVASAIVSGPDTIRTVYQDCFEIPIGVRLASYYGKRSFRTRYYGAAGLRLCLLNDARHDYRTYDYAATGENVVRPGEYNSFWVRIFAEGGLDIPMDYGSAILVGLNVSSGLTRNMSTDGALTKDNFGVPVIGGSIGLRFSL